MKHGKSPLHPGIVLLEQVMQPLAISRNQLARDIDVPVGRISDITNGKRGITADTALRLAHYFGTEAELWVRLQAEYDLHVARINSWPAIKPRVRVMRAPEAAGGTGDARTDRAVAGGGAPAQAVERIRLPVAAPAETPAPATYTLVDTVIDTVVDTVIDTPPPVPEVLPRPLVDANDPADAERSAPQAPVDPSEPYILTDPLEEDDVVGANTEGLVIPPLPEDK